MIVCKVCKTIFTLDYDNMTYTDICEDCYLSKEIESSEKHLKGYDETKTDYLASIDSEGYQDVWGGGRYGF